MPTIHYTSLAKLLKSRKKIEINSRLLEALGIDSYPMLIFLLNDYSSTHNRSESLEYTTWQKFLRAFIKDVISKK